MKPRDFALCRPCDTHTESRSLKATENGKLNGACKPGWYQVMVAKFTQNVQCLNFGNERWSAI